LFWIRAADAHNSCGNDINDIFFVNNATQNSTYTSEDNNIASGGDDTATDADAGTDTDTETGTGAGTDTESSFMDNNGARNNSAALYDDNFSSIINTTNDEYIAEIQADREINLLDVNQFDTEAFRKKITNLFKIRCIMKEHMTASGTHDSNPWNFIEAAMKHIPGYTKVLVYYFYVRCEEHTDVDANFTPFLDINMKGDTANHCTSPEASGSSGKKRKEQQGEVIMQQLLQQGETMMKMMSDAAKDRQKRNKFLARIEISKELGDQTELLRKLMDEANAPSDM
jgi:hypothetical protein